MFGRDSIERVMREPIRKTIEALVSEELEATGRFGKPTERKALFSIWACGFVRPLDAEGFHAGTFEPRK